MRHRTFELIAGSLFSLIAFGHLLRIVFGWEAVFNGQVVPMWPSWLALLLGGFLGIQGIRLSRSQ